MRMVGGHVTMPMRNGAVCSFQDEVGTRVRIQGSPHLSRYSIIIPETWPLKRVL